MNTQNNTPASRNEEADNLSEVKARLAQLLNTVSSTAYAYGEAYGSDSEYLDPAYNWKTLKAKSALALAEALAAVDALAAPGAAIDAREQGSDHARLDYMARSLRSIADRGRAALGDSYPEILQLCATARELASRQEPPVASAQALDVLQFAPKFSGVSGPEPTLERIIWRYYSGAIDDEQDAQHFAKLYVSALRAALSTAKSGGGATPSGGRDQ